MGLLTCSIHGEAGVMSNASKGLCDLIKNKIYIEKEKIYIFNVSYYDNEGFIFDENYFFTESEYKNKNIKKKYKIINNKEEGEFENTIKYKIGVTCVKCFKDYMGLINLDYKFFEKDEE